MRRASLISAILSCTLSWPCATASDGRKVLLSGEQILIVWNPKTKTEHFVRQASFVTETPEFGFVVPTPTVPELAAADSTLFGSLATYVAKLMPRNSLGVGSRTLGGKGGGGEVEVVQVKEVGDYVATTIRATSAKALSSWLGENGFVSRPALESWCAHYARQRWVFTAFRYNGSSLGLAGMKAVRLSFKTDRPFHPYKIPTDSWPKPWRKPMTVYLVAPTELTANYGGTNKRWEAKWLWAGEFSGPIVREVATMASLTHEAFPIDAALTVLRNNDNETGYEQDLDFRPVSDPVAWLLYRGSSAGLQSALPPSQPAATAQSACED